MFISHWIFMPMGSEKNPVPKGEIEVVMEGVDVRCGCKDIFVNLRLNESQAPELSQLCMPQFPSCLFASGLMQFHTGWGWGVQLGE